MAKGIDQVFEGNRKQSFGRAVDNLFNLSHYDKSYALVVGISQYTGDFKSITSARNDANRMKDFLINEAGFDHVHMLTEEKVTQNRLYNIIAQFSRKIGKRDRFVFYWSGHGESYSINDRKIGFLPFSSAGTSDIGNMLMMSTLREWDTLIKANQALYIVDACFSGLANAIDVKSAKRNLTLNQLAQPSRQILTAGQDDETTIASNHYKGSLFTTAVIDELRGTFDATGRYHHDGIVSANELILAVRSRINHEVLTNPSLRGFKLTPTLKEMVPSKGDFFFLSNKQKVDKAIGYVTPSQKNTVEIKSQQNSQSRDVTAQSFSKDSFEHQHIINNQLRKHTHPNGRAKHVHNVKPRSSTESGSIERSPYQALSTFTIEKNRAYLACGESFSISYRGEKGTEGTRGSRATKTKFYINTRTKALAPGDVTYATQNKIRLRLTYLSFDRKKDLPVLNIHCGKNTGSRSY